MPHPTKKQRIEVNRTINVDDFVANFGDLSDVLPNIFGFLTVKNIMRSRRINKKSMEAVRKTIPPTTYFFVDSVEKFNALTVMTEAMPNLQQITLSWLGWRQIWSDGEDANEVLAARYAHFTSHDIEIISNFSKLRMLSISSAPLNGRYRFLFSSFPLLQKLDIDNCGYLKWDLEMLAGLPVLKELKCCRNPNLTGNISSLRVLKDSLVEVKIYNCPSVEGNFMDLADFPHLKELVLEDTLAVTGDIRDIGESDFSSLERLDLPNGVYGASGAKFQRISDGPKLIKALYPLTKHRPHLSISRYWFLSEDSPDCYESRGESDLRPFHIWFVEAGSRIGYRWINDEQPLAPCEVNWLDPEPDRESSDYEKYIEELQVINSQVTFYRGFHQPPTEEEYNRLLDRFEEEGRWW